MRQLLESFAAEEGFRMDDDSSFSEGEEEEELDEEEQHKNTVPGEYTQKLSCLVYPGTFSCISGS